MNSTILDATGNPMIAGKIGPEVTLTVPLVEHDPANPTHQDFARYAAWRRSKCIPRDYDLADEHRADMAQAHLELLGEIAEIGHLIQSFDPKETDRAAFRDKMIDECGDVLFCLSWAADSWTANPLEDADFMAMLPEKIGQSANDIRATHPVAIFMTLSIAGGLLANSAKKAIYQGRAQSLTAQAERISIVLIALASVLLTLGADLTDAAKSNIAKLDARYPAGSTVAGGGIRTGAGA